MKNVVLLGATGSIGSSTLNVLRQNKEIFTLKVIALQQNLDIALEIVNEFSPEHVFISNKNINTDHPIFSSGSKIVTCLEELKLVIQNPAIEIVISAQSLVLQAFSLAIGLLRLVKQHSLQTRKASFLLVIF